MSLSTIEKNRLILNGPKDWDAWLLLIKGVARCGHIWQFVNPDTPEEDLPVLSKPVKPTANSIRILNLTPKPTATPAETPATSHNVSPRRISKSDLSSVEKEELEDQLETYDDLKKEYEKQVEAMDNLVTRIQGSIRRDFLTLYCKDLEPYAMLKALQYRFAQTPEQKKKSLIARWTSLQDPKKRGRDIETWLQKWETTYDNCRAIGLPDVNGMRPIHAFVTAVHSIAPSFADHWRLLLIRKHGRDDPRAAFKEAISQFREWRRLTQYDN